LPNHSSVCRHIVPLLTDRGFATSTAAAVSSGAGLALVAGRLPAGYLLNRIFAPYVAVIVASGLMFGLGTYACPTGIRHEHPVSAAS
jgi:hypothetical protein